MNARITGEELRTLIFATLNAYKEDPGDRYAAWSDLFCDARAAYDDVARRLLLLDDDEVLR